MYVLNFLASINKCLSMEKVFDILNGSDECIIRDSGENVGSDETDEYEGDITAADAVVDEKKVT
jgi:U3 small nucleolar RNA-associated protein 14